MLTVMALVPLLYASCVVVGTALGSFDRLIEHLRIDERLALSFFLGLGFMAVAAQAVSLLGPVGPLLVVTLVALGLLVAGARRRGREQLIEIARLLGRQAHGWRGPAAVVVALAGVALIHSVRTTYFDTRHYHYQAIQWFATYGAVPGLGLLHVRLGFASAWLAWLAAFDAGAGTGRLMDIGSGLILFGALLSWALAAGRCLLGQAERSDHFWAFLVPAILGQPWGGWQLNSASPDLAATFLGAGSLWLTIALCDRRPAWASIRSRPRAGDGLALFALAAVAGTMKLSTIVLPLVGGCFYLWCCRFGWRRLVTVLALGSALTVPEVLFGLRATGAPLFPMGALSTGGPSALTRDEAAEITQGIRAYAYVGDDLPTLPADPRAILRIWLHQLGLPYTVTLPTLVVLGVLASVILLRRERRSPAVFWTIACCWSGLLFWLLSAPNPRFGALYLTGTLALWVADERARTDAQADARWPSFPLLGFLGALLAYRIPLVRVLRGLPVYPLVLIAWVYAAHRLALRAPRSTGAASKKTAARPTATAASPAPWILALAGVTSAVCLYQHDLNDSFTRHLVLPAHIGADPWREVRSNDLVYHLVVHECRAVPLPCAQEWNDPARIGIRLRDPTRGLAGGFARSDGEWAKEAVAPPREKAEVSR